MKDKKIYIYISPVLVIIILTLTFFIMISNKSQNDSLAASVNCKTCNNPTSIIKQDSTGYGHYYYCEKCRKNAQDGIYPHTCPGAGNKHSSDGKCTVCSYSGAYTINKVKKSDSEHTVTCSKCAGTTEAHNKYYKSITADFHLQACRECDYTSQSTLHDKSYRKNTYAPNAHDIWCNSCNAIVSSGTCSYTLVSETKATCMQSGEKKYACSNNCGNTKTESLGKGSHSLKTTTTNPTCTVPGSTVTKCTTSGCTYNITTPIPATGHTYTETEQRNCTSGQKIKTCACGDVQTENIGGYGHTGATHENGGKCTRTGCGQVYNAHTQTTTIVSYTKTEQGHIPIYKCSNASCSQTYTGTIVNHTYDNGAVTKQATCTVKGTKTYTCTVCKTTKQEDIPALDHTGGTHENGGKCTRCNTAYQNHTISYNTLSETVHQIKCATCGVTGQEGHSTTNTTEKAATCSNPGVTKVACTKCSYSTQQPIQAIGHTGATHANGGKCTRTGCGQVYDVHSKSTTAASYSKSKDGHTLVYKCSNTKCTETYNGTLEQHKVTTYTDTKNGTHKGTCTICAYDIIESHNYVNDTCDKCGAKRTSISENEDNNGEHKHSYITKKDETKHWEECSKCKIVKDNSEKNHSYKYTKESSGKHTATCTECNYSKSESCAYSANTCTKCGSAKPQEECTHEYTYTKGTNGKHTVTCTKCKDSKTENCTYSGDKCTKCGATKPTEQEECTHEYTYTKAADGKHTVTCTKCKDSKTENCTYTNNKCTKCGAEKSVEQEKCEHEWKIKIDKNYHWSVCSKCSDVKEGSKAKHEIETHKDNKDGTHSGTCTICKETITVAHAGDDKCDICGAKIEDNSGNNGENNNEGNNNGKDDTTVKDDKIPQTGIQNSGIIVIIGVVLTLGIISIKKFKSYKDIK